MISAIIVLSLLSLLVATEPDTVRPAVPPSPEPPLRPAGKAGRTNAAESGRWAA